MRVRAGKSRRCARPPTRRCVRRLPPLLLSRWGGLRADGSAAAACAPECRAVFPQPARAARHVPGLGQLHSVAGDLSELSAMTAPCSRLSRLPRRRGLRFVPFPPPLLLLLLLAAVGPARGWESGDLELFDLVEEVQLNFYQFLGVQQVSWAVRPPEGGASRAETCGTGRKGGGGAGFALAASERAGTVAKTGSSRTPAALVRPVPLVSSLPQPQKELSASPRSCPPCSPSRVAGLCQTRRCHQQPTVVVPSLSFAVLGEILKPSCTGGRRKSGVWERVVSHVSKFSPSQLHFSLGLF